MSRTYLPVVVFYLSLILIICQSGQAQEKWGKVSKEVLAMKVLPEDSTAPAAVLFDVGKMEISKDFTMDLERHVRIKILSEEGKEAANIKIRYWHKDEIRNLGAHTILSTGKKIKIKKNQIFEEELKNYYKQKVFSIPGVEVGSVIEYKYKLHSEYLQTLEPWFFQNEYYTKLSKISVSILPGFNYTAFQRNIFGEEASPTEEDFIIPGVVAKSGRTFTWELANLPGISKEPYMLTMDDYRMALFFQLTEYRDPWAKYTFIKTWDDLSEKLSNVYEEYSEGNGKVKENAANLTTDIPALPGKVKQIYNFVRDEIETNWISTIYPHNKPQDVLEKRKGTPTEKNFLLLSLLRSAGIDAKPVLISTRRNGELIENWPQLAQFDRVIVTAEAGSQKYFMDAADKYCPFCTLPKNDLVKKGFLINGKRGDLVSIPPPEIKNLKSVKGEIELDSEGNLHGKYLMQLQGYESVAMREYLNKSDVKEYLSDWLTDQFADAKLDTFEIVRLDSVEVPFEITLDFSVPQFAQVANDKIYLPVPFLNSQRENPFRRAKRSFAVDYDYTRENSENIVLNLPNGYEVIESPAHRQLNIKGANYILDCTQEENRLKVSRTFRLGKMVFFPVEYSALRNFYSEVVTADQSQLVLQQKTESVEN